MKEKGYVSFTQNWFHKCYSKLVPQTLLKIGPQVRLKLVPQTLLKIDPQTFLKKDPQALLKTVSTNVTQN